MKILVTGSTGFVGSHLCKALVKQGHRVLAFHRASSTLRMLEGLDVEHVIGDLTQPETLDSAMAGIDVVFHTAALLGDRDEPGRMFAVTVEGTRSLMQAARSAGVGRVIHTSSVAALGVPEKSLLKPPVLSLMDESHTWNYRPEFWPYGYTKYLAELEVQKAVSRGLNAVIVNPAVVLGPGDVYRQSNSIIVQIAKKRIPGVVDGGLNVVHIEDVVAGHLAALTRGSKGARYILGGENLHNTEFVERIAAVAGVPAPKIVFSPDLLHRVVPILKIAKSFMSLPFVADMLYLTGYHFFYDIRKAKKELGLSEPRTGESAIRDAYQWFRDIGAIA